MTQSPHFFNVKTSHITCLTCSLWSIGLSSCEPIHPTPTFSSLTAPIPAIICNIDFRCSHYQKEDSLVNQHLIAQTAYQNPNQSNGPQYAGNIYSVGWQKVYEEASKIGITGIAAKVAKDPDRYCKLQSHVPEQNTFIVKKQHNALKAPGLEPNFKEDPNGFTCHLSLTISNFANLPQKDDDASPSYLSCLSQSNRPLVTWLKKTLK
ncbi:hypothetical protein VP01_2051g1 [Puccinia sorghi]|uniref:Tet-like 2OG-Fe(II) oxygenase domain-containing protein n=1 Tax=Puccinia sorghi TaxID=27349 RepID=A0A0L6VAS2_9BASI|nr:hypothetical protein VP01_2051g1 [Puccinia sorghi]